MDLSIVIPVKNEADNITPLDVTKIIDACNIGVWCELIDPQGRLDESYADALTLIATALPYSDHLWRDTVMADDTRNIEHRGHAPCQQVK